MFHRFRPFGVTLPPILCLGNTVYQTVHCGFTESQQLDVAHEYVQRSSPGSPIGVSFRRHYIKRPFPENWMCVALTFIVAQV
jgi:hypothetical protein